MKALHLLFIFWLLLPLITHSQQSSEISVGRIVTVDYMNALAFEDSTYFDRKKLQEKEIKKFRKRGVKKDFILPVVFHIVNINGMPDITESQVFSQLDALNRDYNEIITVENHPNDKDKKYDSRKSLASIMFCLPKSNGNNGKAITLKSAEVDLWVGYNAVKGDETGGTTPWNTEKYINIWITKLEDDIAGYAQMPGGKEEYDGIVIDYRYFGQEGTSVFPYNEGKTLTHLMGSYLGLYPIWGEFECSDDYVEDTPIHNSPNYGCPEGDHVTICEGNQIEMTMNFMDATYDACRYMFTQGQIKRMQATISDSGARSKLSKTNTDCDQEPDDSDLRDKANIRSTENNNLKNNTVEINPNPVTDQLYVDLILDNKIENIIYSVISLSGQVIEKGLLSNSSRQHIIAVKNWRPGVYFISFQFDNELISKKFIIQ